MAKDYHHIQIRLNGECREKIDRLAQKHNRSSADIVRTSLTIGLRVTEKLLDIQAELVGEFMRLLKKDSRAPRNRHSNREKPGKSPP